MARGKKIDPDLELFAQIKANSKAEGFREGYKRALFDMRHQAYRLAEDMDAAAENSAGDGEIRETVTVKNQRKPREGSDQQRVLDTIRALPGQRGVDIVAALAKDGAPVQERTVRTALSRLKKRGIIRQEVTGGWHPTTQQ